jgi:hypothetical protein
MGWQPAGVRVADVLFAIELWRQHRHDRDDAAILVSSIRW